MTHAPKISRSSLIAVMDGVGVAAINAELAKHGFHPLSDVEEQAILDKLGKTPEQAALDAKLAADFAKATGGTFEKAAGAEAEVPDAPPKAVIDCVLTAAFHRIVDVMRSLHPELYKQYAEMKYSGGNKAAMTPATKRAAYLFAFEKMYDAYKG
jgi:hypothetical protein